MKIPIVTVFGLRISLALLVLGIVLFATAAFIPSPFSGILIVIGLILIGLALFSLGGI